MHYTIKKSTEAATTLATLKSVGGKNDVSKLIIFLKLLIFLTSKVCYKFDIVLNWPQKKVGGCFAVMIIGFPAKGRQSCKF